jgi:alanine dehydrogenase
MHIATDRQIRDVVTIGPIIEAVEAAFRALGDSKSSVFPVARGTGSSEGHIVAVKSCRDGSTGLIGVKVAGYRPENRVSGMHAHSSTTLLVDDATGFAIAMVEANYLNGLRTAAAGAVAARYLAREDAATLGIIGTGAQAVFEVEALAAVRNIEQVSASARSVESGHRFATDVKARTGLDVVLRSTREVVEAVDILVTATPATGPLFDSAWVKPGTHISAIGSDNVGKHELPVELLSHAILVMDYPPQTMILGEAQHLIYAGLATPQELEERSLGSLVTGRISGRESRDAITVFDSTGVAVQDVAAASCVLDMLYPGWRNETATAH